MPVISTLNTESATEALNCAFGPAPGVPPRPMSAEVRERAGKELDRLVHGLRSARPRVLRILEAI